MASAHVLQIVLAPPIVGGAYFAVTPQSSAQIRPAHRGCIRFREAI
jgi:hypothetical protein